ncbi:MAG: hypothetical protein DMG01_20175 [Acidobacteria bacterium]|nr:MAG: hypothetical protein DMG01_20175 [Acidobacteriota bacterium]
MAGPSLRSRFVVGTVLWTAGLLMIGHMISLAAISRVPALRGAHQTFTGAFIALALMAIGLSQVRNGLSSVNHLRERLARLRDGRDRRIDGDYPAEVQPLVDDLNALLEHRDLAHGLKTPLAVLSQEADRTDAEAHHELAATIGQQIERMRRQIDYHLAHARAAASGATLGARCGVLASAEGLSRTLQRLHAGRGLVIDLHVDTEHAVRAQREDLDEMLGNLLDNACKWTSSRVVVSSAADAGSVEIVVDDDGPGLAASMRDAVLQRGVRADQAAPGSGLGLAIVRDLAEVYGGAIALDRSPMGGLRARLPTAAAAAPVCSSTPSKRLRRVPALPCRDRCGS